MLGRAATIFLVRSPRPAVIRLARLTGSWGARTVSYAYDQFGQAVRKDVAGKVTTYAYDWAGRLLQAAGPDSEILYVYDRRGRTKTELVDSRAMNYAYDILGRRARRTTPTGAVTEYGYDAAGRIARMTSGGREITFTHDAAGRELQRAFGNSLALASAWDEAGRICAQHLTTGDRSLNHRHYAHRADGYLTSVTDDLSGTRNFDLDPTGRVTAVHAEDWTERYAYDAAGNQTTASWPGTQPGHDATGPRSYTGTSLTRAGNVRFEHDALGRVTLRQRTRLSRKPDTWRYEWDAEDRLAAVVTPDGTRWRYRYDPLGRRTAKQRLADDGETVAEEVRFSWDGTTLCEQTIHTPGLSHVVALTWDHRGLVPLSQTERLLTPDTHQEEIDRRFFAIATDLVGTPTELVDESGEIAWRARSTLWGTTAWARSSTAYTPLRFPGQYYDPETGLHYNLFRHYDPETGRYTSPDPLGLSPAPNPVAYLHNPFTVCDPPRPVAVLTVQGSGLADGQGAQTPVVPVPAARHRPELRAAVDPAGRPGSPRRRRPAGRLDHGGQVDRRRQPFRMEEVHVQPQIRILRRGPAHRSGRQAAGPQRGSRR
ncbi:RHS repeat-associated core domain-containing protein [Streptomyces sp. NPDC056255]|uniref:RHS repeat-associated core domain-containing protein n=1 Tax=Streptomyces sp. NPDC056255 TaxID=3345764 RepID=UPI0035E27C7A